MKTRKLIFATLLITMGLGLNLITPPLLGLMKPDFLLAMYLIAITQLSNFKELSVITIVCAVLSSMTTSMPGAEIANFIEKCITGLIVYSLLVRISNVSSIARSILIGGVGTLISGTLFLVLMILTGFLNADILPLMLSVVLPTSIINIFIFALFERTFKKVKGVN